LETRKRIRKILRWWLKCWTANHDTIVYNSISKAQHKRKKCSFACIWCMRERNGERSYRGGVVWSSLIGTWNYMRRRWNWGSPSLEVEQVKQQKKNDREENRNWKNESLVKFKLKLLRVKMGRGWSLREAHQSPKIQKGLDVETNDQYSELKRLYRRVTNALLNVFMERG